ncbi:hypothetical protein CLV51_11167 [Chitinophaga niastensis]|uniref:Uncharacterized protein n=1 Tax=Chitinophaga niastensis TaxID=536980 RepID=A0A2P8H8Y2_CHINA|nr:hypothetical protein [Chitinophaga niastensis]PSL42682.1 hypothetical protein CLV51_11167 [Chitinophaga niastensis]
MKLQGLLSVCAGTLFCIFSQKASAQQLKLGMNPTLLNKNALLELNADKQGLLLPRIAKVQILAGGALFGAADGMFVYIIDDKALYLKKTAGWQKVLEFSDIIAGTGIGIAGSTITNTGVTTFKTRTGDILPAAGDYSINMMGDATITAPANNQLLQYQAGKWINWTPPNFALASRNLSIAPGTGIASVTAAPVGTDLSADRTWTITADNGTALWNANKLSGVPILFTIPPANNDVLTFNGTQWQAKAPAAATGVTSVGLTMPSIFTVTGSPVTTSGTLTAALASQTANQVFAAPNGSNGVPLFRLLTATDIPNLDAGKITTGTLPVSRGGTGVSAIGSPGDMLRVKDATTLEFFTPAYVATSRQITLAKGTGIASITPLPLGADLSADRTWTITADNTNALWNANKIQNNAVSTATPNDGDVLKWNVASSTYVPAPDITGGASYGNLASNDITYADAPDPKYRMKIWASPTSGIVTNGPGGTSAWAWSVLSFQNTGYTTQLYFDKNTLALREWKNNPAPPPPLIAGTNPWYKVVTTLGSNAFTPGGLLFANQTVDATTETTQDAANLFWDNTNKELGIKTNTPAASLDVNGTVKLGATGTILTNVMKGTVTLPSSGNMNNNTSRLYTGAITVSSGGTVNANATIIINPQSNLATGMIIGWARSTGAGNNINVSFTNSSGAVSNPAGTYDVTIIQ